MFEVKWSNSLVYASELLPEQIQAFDKREGNKLKREANKQKRMEKEEEDKRKKQKVSQRTTRATTGAEASKPAAAVDKSQTN